MEDHTEVAQLLGIAIALLGRTLFPPDELRQIIMPTERSRQQLRAYNLCDGGRTRSEISRAVGLDKDNFNKAVGRWLHMGVLYEIKLGDRIVLRHLYRLAE